MAHKESTRLQARQYYVYKSLSLKEVANAMGVAYSTVREWKKKAASEKDNWDSARSAYRMGAAGLGELTDKLIENFALQADALIQDLNDAPDVTAERRADVMIKLSDGYSKLVASAAKSGTKVAPLSIALKVLQMLGEFIKARHPEQSSLFLEVLEPFGVQLTKEFG